MTDQRCVIQFVASPVFEGLAAMFRVNAHESLLSDKSREIAGQPFELNKWVEQKRAALPEREKKELELFFNIESFFGLTLIRYAWDKKVFTDIPHFLQSLEQLSSKEIFSYFLKTGYASDEVIDIDNLDDVQAYIEKSNLPEEEKWKALYLYVHHDQTKQRLLHLLQFFYGLLKDEMDELAVKQLESINEMKAFAKAHGEEELLKLLSVELQPNCEYPREIVLAPSVFYYDCSLSSEFDDSLILLYGIKQVHLQSALTVDKDQVIKAFKVLADEKRIDIIRLLNQGPLYGYELGQKLNLSNSTVSHHLSSLSSVGLVKATRKESRVYYEVQKMKIETLLKQMKETLIRE